MTEHTPAAWQCTHHIPDDGKRFLCTSDNPEYVAQHDANNWYALYTAPGLGARPLTKEEIALINADFGFSALFDGYVRAIEKAHGIGEPT